MLVPIRLHLKGNLVSYILQISNVVRSSQLEFVRRTTAEDNVLGLPFGAIVLGDLYHVLPVIRIADRWSVFNFEEHAPTDCHLVCFSVYQESGPSHRIKSYQVPIEGSAAVLRWSVLNDDLKVVLIVTYRQGGICFRLASDEIELPQIMGDTLQQQIQINLLLSIIKCSYHRVGHIDVYVENGDSLQDSQLVLELLAQMLDLMRLGNHLGPTFARILFAVVETLVDGHCFVARCNEYVGCRGNLLYGHLFSLTFHQLVKQGPQHGVVLVVWYAEIVKWPCLLHFRLCFDFRCPQRATGV